MLKRSHSVVLGMTILCASAVVLSVFLMPSKPDLIARSTKIVDLSGTLTFQLHWLDGHRLITAEGGSYYTAPSMVAIDVSSRTIMPLPAVNATLRRIAKTHPLMLLQILPSPDGQWLLCAPGSQTFGTGRMMMQPRLIRVRDGRYLMTAPVSDSFWITWLPDSRQWTSRSYWKLNPIICSIDDPLKVRSVPAPTASWYTRAKHMNADEVDDFMGSGRTLVADRSHPGRRFWDGYGVASPDRTHIAWLWQDDWLDRAPTWVASVLSKLHYHSHVSGEIWTVRLDGTDRREIGTFGSQFSPSDEIHDLDWTPDSKSLIFVRGNSVRGGVLYSVLADGK